VRFFRRHANLLPLCPLAYGSVGCTETPARLPVPTEAPAPPPVAALPTASASATAEPASSDAPAPIALGWPDDARCTVTGKKSALDPGVPLRLGPGRDVFATALGQTTLKVALIGPNDTPSGVADAESGGVFVRGAVDMASLRVHPSHALVLGAFFIPHRGASLVMERLGDTGIVVRPPLDPRVVPVNALVDEVTCRDISIDSPAFDPLSALPQRPGVRAVEFVPGIAHFSLTETGKPVVGVRIDDTGILGRTLARGALADRLSVVIGGDVVFGWVAHTAFFEVNKGSGSGTSTASDGIGIRGKRIRTDRCERELSLSVTLGGSSQVVGALRAHTTFDVAAEGAGGATIHVVGSNIRLATGAELLINEHDGECSTVETPAAH